MSRTPDFATALAAHAVVLEAIAELPKGEDIPDRLADREARTFAALLEAPAPDLPSALRKLDILAGWIAYGRQDGPVREAGCVINAAALNRVRGDFRRLIGASAG